YRLQTSATSSAIVANTVSPSGVVGPPVPLFNPATIANDSQLATLSNGSIVAVFDNQFMNNPANHDIFFTITAANLTTIVPVTGVATTADNEVEPHVAALADGGFVVTWTDITTADVRAQVYDASGAIVHPGILVNFFNQTGNVGVEDVTALPDVA